MVIPQPGGQTGAAAPGPSAEPLPDFSGIDAAALLRFTDHPVLAGVGEELLRRWPRAEEAVAYYEDGPN